MISFAAVYDSRYQDHMSPTLAAPCFCNISFAENQLYIILQSQEPEEAIEIKYVVSEIFQARAVPPDKGERGVKTSIVAPGMMQEWPFEADESIEESVREYLGKECFYFSVNSALVPQRLY